MKPNSVQDSRRRRNTATRIASAIACSWLARCLSIPTATWWAPKDPSAQALQCLHNLERLLAVHEFQVTDIRQLVVYVVGDQASLAAAWSAVAGWFGGQVPPATLLGVAGLGYVGQLVEIDTTVIKA